MCYTVCCCCCCCCAAHTIQQVAACYTPCPLATAALRACRLPRHYSAILLCASAAVAVRAVRGCWSCVCSLCFQQYRGVAVGRPYNVLVLFFQAKEALNDRQNDQPRTIALPTQQKLHKSVCLPHNNTLSRRRTKSTAPRDRVDLSTCQSALRTICSNAESRHGQQPHVCTLRSYSTMPLKELVLQCLRWAGLGSCGRLLHKSKKKLSPWRENV